MISQRIVIKYPPRLADKPVISRLTREYDLEFNILRAQVSPETGGLLVLEISGKRDMQERALESLHAQGVATQKLSQDVGRDAARCTHCGLCVSLCPSDALTVDAATQEVSFDSGSCVACEYCIKVCPVEAMHVAF